MREQESMSTYARRYATAGVKAIDKTIADLKNKRDDFVLMQAHSIMVDHGLEKIDMVNDHGMGGWRAVADTGLGSWSLDADDPRHDVTDLLNSLRARTIRKRVGPLTNWDVVTIGRPITLTRQALAEHLDTIFTSKEHRA